MATKSRLTDLNEHLFAQLERLSDEELKGEALVEEIERSRAVNSVAAKIVDNARLVLDAQKSISDRVIINPPAMLCLPENR